MNILALADLSITIPPTTGSVAIEELSSYTPDVAVPVLCTRGVSAAVAGWILLKIQSRSPTITTLFPEKTFVPAFVIASSVVTLILIDRRAVTRLGGGGHGGE